MRRISKTHCLCVSVSKTPTTPTTRSLEPLLSETDRHASRHTSQVLTTHDRGSHKRAKSKIQGLLEESDGNLYCTQQWPKFSSPITSKHDTSQLQSRAGTLKPITSKYFPLYWGWTEQCEKIQDRKQEACLNFQRNVDIGDLEILYFTSGHDSAVHNKVR